VAVVFGKMQGIIEDELGYQSKGKYYQMFEGFDLGH
jgi:hypothetical protein